MTLLLLMNLGFAGSGSAIVVPPVVLGRRRADDPTPSLGPSTGTRSSPITPGGGN